MADPYGDYIKRIVIVEEVEDFPDPAKAPPDFPAGVGRELTAELMLGAYRKGLFAWSDDPVTWWSPDPRGIIELAGLHVSRSLARTIRQGRFEVTVDEAFRGVVSGCAAPRAGGEETWITDRFVAGFETLFRMGYAHSVECWKGGRLVGGVFGVGLGGFFSAESMFHTATDASKVAVFHLVRLLAQAGYTLLDIQILTPHTESLGAVTITREDYLRRLSRALARRTRPLSTVLIEATARTVP